MAVELSPKRKDSNLTDSSPAVDKDIGTKMKMTNQFDEVEEEK